MGALESCQFWILDFGFWIDPSATLRVNVERSRDVDLGLKPEAWTREQVSLIPPQCGGLYPCYSRSAQDIANAHSTKKHSLFLTQDSILTAIDL